MIIEQIGSLIKAKTPGITSVAFTSSKYTTLGTIVANSLEAKTVNCKMKLFYERSCINELN